MEATGKVALLVAHGDGNSELKNAHAMWSST
jgi:hypothetical protein